MNQKDLQQILDDHKKWLNSEGGKRADLSYSNLSNSDLSYSNLSYSNLRGSDLSYSNLYGVNLTGADLTGANLAGVKGMTPERYQPFLLIKYQVGKIRAFKVVDDEFKSPCASTKLTYVIGDTVEVEVFNDDPQETCGAGVNLATLDWCLKTYSQELRHGHHLLLCEFAAADIVAIPYASDGKFRVKKCKVIREIDASEWVKIEGMGI